MNGPDILASFRAQLAGAISTETCQSTPPEPLPISSWVAMSLLQKAIRRGEEQFALQAAATLLHSAPDRLWRRLGCIAFEDIGLADMETVGLVTSAVGSKRFRASLGGEWLVASYLISGMVQAPKSRAADDLLMTAEQHPTFERDRLRLTFRTLDELLGIVTSDGDLHPRALALWYAIGTERRPSDHLRQRRGNPTAVFDHLCDVGYPHTLVEIVGEGFRLTGEMLCPFVVLLHPEHRAAAKTITDDRLPPTVMCGAVPGWALDVYSQEGRRAFSRFLRTNAPTAKWIRTHVHPQRRVKFLGDLVFRVEGGLLRRRQKWPVANQLRRMFEMECLGHECSDAAELMGLMRSDLNILSGVRHVA